MVELVGWHGDGPRLSLGALIDDPEAEVRRWAADLALDCERVRDVLVPVSNLLNGLRGPTLTGQGTPRNPFRCAPAGVSQAPGLAVWLEPGCPLVQPPNRFDTGRLWSSEPLEPAELAAVIASSGAIVPSIADLLVARNGLAEGLTLLRQRWVGTDGLVAAPASLPDGVGSVVVPGVSYTDLVARGATRRTGLRRPRPDPHGPGPRRRGTGAARRSSRRHDLRRQRQHRRRGRRTPRDR